MSFKSKALAGKLNTSKLFVDAYYEEVQIWHKIPLDKRGTLESFLGVTFAEVSVLHHNIEHAYTCFQNKTLFVIPTVEQIDKLLSIWSNTYEVRSVLRFGQYVYNEIFFEFENSYNQTDCMEAYNSLIKGIALYSKKEEE